MQLLFGNAAVTQHDDKKSLREETFEDERGILQIEKAMKKTIFEIDGKRISADEAISLIGRRNFLCGMDRCAFHADAVHHTALFFEVKNL